MKKTEYLIKKVEVLGDYGVVATRSRNSSGACSITVEAKGERMAFSSAAHGDNYEMLAREVSRALDEVCDDRCLLHKDGK